MSHYILRPRPPRRALLLGGVLTVVGLVVLILSFALAWSLAIVIIAAFVTAIGLAILILVCYSMINHRLHVELNNDGFQVRGPDFRRSGSWDEVTKVALTPDGSRLVIASGPIKRTYIISPSGGDDPSMKALVDDVSQRIEIVKR